MTEAFTVASELTFRTNALVIVADLIKQFNNLDTAIERAQKNLATLAAELRALNAGGRGLAGAARSLEALAKTKLSPDLLTGMRDVSAVTGRLVQEQRDLAKYANETAAAWRSMGRTGPRGPVPGTPPGAGGAPAPGAPGGTPPRRGRQAAGGSHDLLNAGIALQGSGHAVLGVIERSFMAEVEVLQQLASLRMNTGVTDADIERVRAKAYEVTKATPGSTLAENLHHLVDAFTVMGNLNEAMEGLPAVAKMAYTIKNLPGVHHGDSTFAAMQAIEVMQRFYDPKTGHVSMEAFNQQLAAMTQVVAGTGGRDDGQNYLGFAKQARVAGMVFNDKFLYRDLPAMQIALGGNRAGTAMAALFSQLITGRMTKQAAEQLKQAGLLDKNAVWKGGMVQDMQHKMHGYEQFGQNPMDWVREYIMGPNGALARKHIDPHDRLAVAKFLSDWASRQTGLGGLSEMVLGAEGIDKEAGKLETTTRDPNAVIQQFDPMQKVREFKAAEQQLYVEMGKLAMGPGLQVLQSLTEVFRYLAETAKAHPDAGKNLMVIGGGLSALAVAAGNLSTAIFIGAPLIGGMRALAGAAAAFGPGAAGATALATLGGAGAGSLLALAGGAIAAVVAINEASKALGLDNATGAGHGGKGLQAPGFVQPPPPAGAGNGIGDAINNWWNTPSPSTSGTRSGGSRGGRQGQAVAEVPAIPPITLNLTVNSEGKINGAVLTSFVTQVNQTWFARQLSGPSQGITGFDTRAGTGGTMMPGP